MRKKRDFYQSRNIHANTPRRLIREWHVKYQWNMREMARKKKINVFYVSQLVRDGIEPTDRTEKGRHARVALCLKARKPRQRIVKPKKVLNNREFGNRVLKIIDHINKNILKRGMPGRVALVNK